MKPLNAPERKRAFLNFLLFFIITIAVILITVFFSIEVPLKDNDKLRAEKDAADREKIYLSEFEKRMLETSNLLDSVNRADNPTRVEKDIGKNITLLTSLSDSISQTEFCNKIIDNLSSLRVAKEQLRAVNNSKEEIAKRDAKIEELDKKVNYYYELLLKYNSNIK